VTASSHGDLFSIWGATCVPDRPHPTGAARCLPSENRAKGANEWNHYRVEANDGVIKLAVNGKFVSGVSKCNPRKGYLAMESEGSECRFRNLKIKELPSTNPKPEEIADEDKGFKAIYTGLDLANFKADEGLDEHWKPSDWRIRHDGRSEWNSTNLCVAKPHGDCEIIVDWSLPANKGKKAAIVLRETDDYMLTASVGTDGRLILLENIGDRAEFLFDKAVPVNPPGQWNRLTAAMKAGNLTLSVNNKPVIEGLALKKLPRRGEIALMDSGAPVEFANLLIRDLK
jgi:Domain of Unknown Function (DUF1080)